MTRRETVLVHKREAIKQAAARNRAKSIALCGSVARAEDGEDSDYDFLVDFLSGTGLFTMAGLRLELEDILGEKVDLVSTKSLRDRCSGMRDDAIVL